MRRVHLARNYRDAVLATNPVSYWRLGETSGTVAKDETGANDGTYVNTPTLAVAGLLSGDPNTAVTFVGGLEAMEVSSPLVTAVDNWTIAGWAQAPSLGTYHIILLNGANQGGTNNGYMLYIDNAGKPTMGYPGVATIVSQQVLTPGATYFLVALRRAGTFYGYLNGVDDTTFSGPTSTPATPTLHTQVGSNATDGTGVGTGTADEPAIWSRALTAAEIARLTQIGRGF